MTDLALTLLIPLEGTLPGWPEAPMPSVAAILFLVAGIPLAIGVVVAFLGKGAEAISASRAEQEPSGTAVSAGDERPELPTGTTGRDLAPRRQG